MINVVARKENEIGRRERNEQETTRERRLSKRERERKSGEGGDSIACLKYVVTNEQV